MKSYQKILKFPFKAAPYEVHLSPGKYKFEAWGAAGYYSVCSKVEYSPGNGGYTSGFLTLKQYKTIYVYVGESGQFNNGVFNGIKYDEYMSGGYHGGGGATDFRLEKGENWYDFSSLKSRIMVAAGGGGSDCFKGGHAGGLIGFNGGNLQSNIHPTPGNQTHGGLAGRSGNGVAHPGGFGIAGSGSCSKRSCNEPLRSNTAGFCGISFYTVATDW